MRVEGCFEPCSGTNAMMQACGSRKPTKRIQPKPVRAASLARGQKVSQVSEYENGRERYAAHITSATSTPPSTFSRSDVAVSEEEYPPFPRKRQPTAEGGENVKTPVAENSIYAFCSGSLD